MFTRCSYSVRWSYRTGTGVAVVCSYAPDFTLLLLLLCCCYDGLALVRFLCFFSYQYICRYDVHTAVRVLVFPLSCHSPVWGTNTTQISIFKQFVPKMTAVLKGLSMFLLHVLALISLFVSFCRNINSMKQGYIQRQPPTEGQLLIAGGSGGLYITTAADRRSTIHSWRFRFFERSSVSFSSYSCAHLLSLLVVYLFVVTLFFLRCSCAAFLRCLLFVLFVLPTPHAAGGAKVPAGGEGRAGRHNQRKASQTSQSARKIVQHVGQTTTNSSSAVSHLNLLATATGVDHLHCCRS